MESEVTGQMDLFFRSAGWSVRGNNNLTTTLSQPIAVMMII